MLGSNRLLLPHAGLHRTVDVRVDGCKPLAARPIASSQWTKSREAARLRCSGRYEDLLAMPALMTDGMSRDEIDGALKRVMPWSVWSQRAADTTRACWYGS